MNWTPAEDRILRNGYQPDGADAVALQLGRTTSAVQHRAKRLNVLRNPRWSAHDDERLRMSWGCLSIRRIAKSLNRRVGSVYWRAKEIGLKRGCPDGHEYLTGAAERTGYDAGQVRRILRWAGVKIWQSASRETGAGRHCHTVEPIEVDDAMARWHKTEPVESAARARGLSGHALRSWLVEAMGRGVAVPPQPKHRRVHWRVPSDIIDSVAAARGGTESVSRGAVRLGVHRNTLVAWLRSAGVPRGETKVWRLPATVIDSAARRAVAMPNSRAAHAKIERAA